MTGDLFTEVNDDKVQVNICSNVLDSLDPEQRAAATSGSGSILVRAGAGTGKTRTLVARIVHLVNENGVDPAKIMAVTFTKKAANEVRERVSSFLGEAAARSISIGTFHSLSAKILRKNAALVGLDSRFVVVPEEDAQDIASLAVEYSDVVPQDVEDRSSKIKLLSEMAFKKIQQWKSWGLVSTAVAASDLNKLNADDAIFAQIYLHYQRELQSRNMVDFGDLILHVVDIFQRDTQVRNYESSLVQHLLIDEAQDSNPSQVRWVRLISCVNRNVFAVGDEDQSIFSFQGGYPGAMLDIVGNKSQHFGLTINRRCTDEILKPAVSLVAWNRRSAPKILQSGVSGEKVGFRVSGGEREEANYIATEIVKEIEAGTPSKEIAVLVRAGWVIQSVEEALLKAGVKYEVVGGVPLMKRKEILVASAYLRLALNCYDDIAFHRVYDSPSRGVGPAAYKAVCDLALRMHIPFYQACEDLQTLDGVRITGNMRKGLDELGSSLRYLYEEFEATRGITTKDLLTYVLDGPVGYRKFLGNGKANKKRHENLKILERIADSIPDLLDFMDDLSLGLEDDDADNDCVRISTMHSSKGLEWEVVFCPAMEMDVVPNKRAITDVRLGVPSDPWNGPSSGGMEEERRLLHVALTRAKRKLYLSCSLTRNGKAMAPSPFIPESGIDPMIAGGGEKIPVKLSRKTSSKDSVGRNKKFKVYGSYG